MKKVLSTILKLIIVLQVVRSQNLQFPDDVLMGTASAAYQIEGAWNVDGKSESIWDYYTHTHPERILDGTNGDVACNSYYDYEEDVRLIKEIGLDFYRFSIAWTRILPSGRANRVNQQGLQYYLNLTKALLENGIEPVVTLYHWDHPQNLEDMGGWTNSLMVDYYTEYVSVVYEALAPYVKTFISINEPLSICGGGYFLSLLAPAKGLHRLGYYQCCANVMKAHARAWHVYHDNYFDQYGGQIGIDLVLRGWLPIGRSNDELVERAYKFTLDFWAQPLTTGDYPEIVKTMVANHSAILGYPTTLLAEFSDDWISYMKNTLDYFGLNHYTAGVAEPVEDMEDMSQFVPDGLFSNRVSDYFPRTHSTWIHVVPHAFGGLLRYVRDHYPDLEINVFETGLSTDIGLNDSERIEYFYEYLKVMFDAIEDGCKVHRYTIWSILDNFEWVQGYTQRFGIVQVDFDDAKRSRTLKSSATWWQSNMAARELHEVPANGTSALEENWNNIE